MVWGTRFRASFGLSGGLNAFRMRLDIEIVGVVLATATVVRWPGVTDRRSDVL